MNESLITSARACLTELHDLKQLQIPRCLQKREQRTEAVSLHTYVYASKDAYGAVVNARYNYPDGAISTNIVAAKNRVAPSITTAYLDWN